MPVLLAARSRTPRAGRPCAARAHPTGARTSRGRAAASTAGWRPTWPAARAPSRSGRSPTPGSAPIRRRARTARARGRMRPFSARWPHCLNASGKTTTSMLPAASSSVKTHMRSPLRVFSGRRPETMPPIEMSSATRPLPLAGRCRWPVRLQRRAAHRPSRRRILAVVSHDRHDGRFTLGHEIGGRLRAVLAQVVGVAIDRMAAPVQAERLLLVVELLDLRPGRDVRQRDDRRA